jgi:putative transposase
MQIRGLHRSIYRAASVASRLATKERSDVVERRDAVARWQQARRDGLTAVQAAMAVGTPLSTLYRWAKDAPVRSRRPKTTRKTTWTSKLVQAVEEWRLEEPTWGEAKIVVKLREQGFTASEATVGRILAHLVKRGAIQPVPTLRKAARTRKWAAKRRFAERLPKAAKPTQPGQIVQLDTVYVTLAPGRHVKHFTPAQYLAARQANETAVSHMT